MPPDFAKLEKLAGEIRDSEKKRKSVERIAALHSWLNADTDEEPF